MNRPETWRQCLARLLLLLAAFTSAQTFAYDKAALGKAATAYEEGFALLKKEHWREAAQSLKNSHALVPFPLTAYLISVASARLGDAGSALTYAEDAIRGRPPLEEDLRAQYRLTEPYVSQARKIIDWAREYQATVRLEGKADSMAATPPPPSPPSRLEIPDLPRLPLQPSAEQAGGMIFMTPFGAMQKVKDLTGTWRCNDGGIYYLRQRGGELWWYGQSGDGGKHWSNVFHGRIAKGRISGRWVDVPRGSARGAGELRLEITKDGGLRAVKRSGGFGGSVWRR